MTYSKPFTFVHNSTLYTAVVRYHDDGDFDVEVNTDDAPSIVYDVAWEVAEELGLMESDKNGDFGDAV